MDQKVSVIIQDHGNKGVIILNRPEVLNALSLSMVTQIFDTLVKWKTEKSFVIIKGSGNKAFCAGGDIKYVYETRKMGFEKLSLDLQKFQSAICSLIKTYPIPYIAIINGVVMGAGSGISLHGRYRIATEKTVFAIPEAQIGNIPDVGSIYLASRLPGKLGYYLALSGNRLEGPDLLRANIATHYCSSKDLQKLEDRLMSCSDATKIDDVLAAFNETNLPPFSLESSLRHLNHCFSGRTVGQILFRLKKVDSEWARNTVKQLKKMSPTSLKVTLKALMRANQMSFHECLLMEYRMVANCLEKQDFYEGKEVSSKYSKFVSLLMDPTDLDHASIRASGYVYTVSKFGTLTKLTIPNSDQGVRSIIIDKDFKPKWNPSSLAEVREDYVDTFFATVSDENELKSKL